MQFFARPNKTMLLFLLPFCITGYAQQNRTATIDQKANAILPQVIESRRYLHQHSELFNREYKTAEYSVLI